MTAAGWSYKGFRFPPEIISHCVWLYHRFPLSFRDVQELMLERGVDVSYETIRAWCDRFGQQYANQLRRRGRPHRETCQESLANAQSEEFLPPDASESRAVVLIAGPANAEWLQEDLLLDRQREEIVVTLDRFSARTLPLQWRDQPKLEELASAELAASVLQVTGGWAAIVDNLAQHTRKVGVEKALDELSEEHENPEWPERFLRETGAIGVSTDLRLLVAAMADYGASCTNEDLEELGLSHGIQDIGRAVTLAQWFSLLDVEDDQLLRLAPLLSGAWKRYEST